MINNIVFYRPEKFESSKTEHEWVTLHFSNKDEYKKNEISFDIYEKLENIL